MEPKVLIGSMEYDPDSHILKGGVYSERNFSDLSFVEGDITTVPPGSMTTEQFLIVIWKREL